MRVVLWVLDSFVFVGYWCYVSGLVWVKCLGLGCLFAFVWLWWFCGALLRVCVLCWLRWVFSLCCVWRCRLFWVGFALLFVICSLMV